MAKRIWQKTFPVRYAWIEQGVEKRGASVASGLTQQDAEKTFQKENKHVAVVQSIVVPNDPMSKVNIAARIAENYL